MDEVSASNANWDDIEDANRIEGSAEKEVDRSVVCVAEIKGEGEG